MLGIYSCSGLKNRNYEQGSQQFDMMNYAVAIEHYTKAWEQEESAATASGLANSYLQMRNFELAESWFAKLDRMEALSNDDRLKFAQSLISSSKFDEARSQLLAYKKSSGEDIDLQAADMMLETIKDAKEILNHPKGVQVKNLTGVNSKYSEFSGVIKGDKIIFASDRIDSLPRNLKVDKYNALKSDIYGWTGNGYLQVYEAKGDWDRYISDSVYKVDGYKSPHHSGPVFEVEDFIFWVKAGKPDAKAKRSNINKKNYTLYPQIIYREKVDGKWGDYKGVPFNHPYEYAVSDPFWDEKNQRLYFSSEQPGGSGKADIYFSNYLGENNWGEPVNLGTAVNTAGEERSPFIDADGNLYFASDGRGGLGGLDVYKAERLGNSWGKPMNLGAPINSSRDDFGFFINPQIPDRGIVSSDRPGGKGLDDIYAVIMEIDSKFYLKGVVRDKETNLPLENAVVELIDRTTGTNFNYVTDENGEYGFLLGDETVYDVEGKKTDYITAEIKGISTKGIRVFEDTTISRDLFLDKIEIGKTLEIENIYYDFDKWEIREDAAKELDKLVKVLNDNPTLKIELNSHTDSRGADKYNQLLSEKRAQSAVDYIIKSGISSGRIVAKGYGESRLLNACEDGVECEEEQHQQNRRTEFTIVDY
ncbi:OmpA family protein [Echinicola sediminis]